MALITLGEGASDCAYWPTRATGLLAVLHGYGTVGGFRRQRLDETRRLSAQSDSDLLTIKTDEIKIHLYTVG